MGFVRDCGDSKEGSTPAAGWIGEINTIWAKGASNTLELARIVFRARRTMGYGAWARMWRSKQLPFGFSKAKMLVRIGEHLGDLDGQTFGRLPSGWSILYELSKLPRAVFEEFLREGVIHSGLKLPEAKALVAEFTGKQTAAEQRKANVRERLRRFEEFVHDTLHGWTTAERELARATLTQLTKRIGQPSSLGFGSAPLPKTAGCSFDAIVLSAADSQPDKPNPSLNL